MGAGAGQWGGPARGDGQGERPIGEGRGRVVQEGRGRERWREQAGGGRGLWGRRVRGAMAREDLPEGTRPHEPPKHPSPARVPPGRSFSDKD